MRFRALIVTFVMMVGVAAAAREGEPVKAVNTDASGLALHGYDPVAYFVSGRPEKGHDAFTYAWQGATWRFASAERRDLFAASPDAYAPQFGGYCAWAVSRNYTADIDPQAFDIVEGKLYLNYSKLVQLRWKADRAGNIRKAQQNWPALLAKGTR
jgi:hypothetical protein